MIITRKIQITVSEDDSELRKSYWEKIYDTRDIAVKAANMVASHLFMQNQTLPYIKDADKLEYVGAKGGPIKKSSTPYAMLSSLFKGKADMGMLSSVNQNVSKCFSDDCKKGLLYGRISLRSYKPDMPVPYPADRFLNIHFAKEQRDGKEYENCYFILTGIPFKMVFGRDRSNNEDIVRKVVSGEYKMATSSIQIDGKKTFLLLCVDMPVQDKKPIKGKTLFAFLGVFNPIICTTEIRVHDNLNIIIEQEKLKKQLALIDDMKALGTSDDIQKAITEEKKRLSADKSKYVVYNIGTSEEFNHRRTQIQEAVKRCQINNRYATGGRGRKRKCQALDRWHDKERNYVDTKLHTYSRMLVNIAARQRCDTIMLLVQKKREDNATQDNQSGDPFVLRNWSYFGLKEKIRYKAKLFGIALKEEKE